MLGAPAADGGRDREARRRSSFRVPAMVGFPTVSVGARLQGKTMLAIAAAAAALIVALALPGGSASAAPAANCPTFQVLHNDRVGPAILPAGTYAMHLTRGSKLTCAKAAQLFARFLEDFDGNIAPWRVVPKSTGHARFLKPGEAGFAVGRSGGRRHHHHRSRLGHLCPGNFRVLHNDRIGPLFFPAGVYQIFIPRHSVLPCRTASNLFARFLTEPSGVLPGKWQMKSNRAVFFRKNLPARRRFRVDPGT
jgi:hypothetical protein